MPEKGNVNNQDYTLEHIQPEQETDNSEQDDEMEPNLLRLGRIVHILQ